MSYDFAVWEGPAPLSNAHATSECQRQLSARSQAPPTVAVRQFVDRLLVVHPDLDQPGGEDSPWSDGPLLNHADGQLIYFGVQIDAAHECAKLVEETAAALELVAFDPQLGQLLPSATTVARSADFELPTASDLPLHLTAVIGEALGAGVAMAGILEQVETGFYVQWMARDGGLTIEAQGEELLAVEHRLGEEAREEMMRLGFVEGDPNWTIHWDDGGRDLQEAGQILSDVLTVVRALPLGTPMALQTFPV